MRKIFVSIDQRETLSTSPYQELEISLIWFLLWLMSEEEDCPVKIFLLRDLTLSYFQLPDLLGPGIEPGWQVQ